MDKQFSITSMLGSAIIGGVISALVVQSISGTYNDQTVVTDAGEEVRLPEGSAASVVQEANDAVVAVRVFGEVRQTNPLQFFFNGQTLQQDTSEPQIQEIGGGSGFMIDDSGHIVTNAHVIDGEGVTFKVVFNEGVEADAELIAADSVLDIAVLKVSEQDLERLTKITYVDFADSDKIVLGQDVIAIGNALAEYENSVSKGIVSGLSRSITPSNQYGRTELLEDVIQTDAAINPGNSGGPLLDFNGDVIGVNVAVVSGSENIGFALPANLVQTVVETIIEEGRVVRPYIGVRYLTLNESIAAENELSVSDGAYIHSVDEELSAILEDSPADLAGLQDGDVITAVNNVVLTETKSLSAVIRTYKVGDNLDLTVQRGNQQLQISITLAEYEQ